MVMETSPLPAKPKSDWRGVDLSLRLQWITESLFVMHPALVRLLGTIRKRSLHAATSRTGVALLVVISSGGGKSHLIRLLNEMMPRRATATHTVVPVVSFSVPGRPSQESMGRELLRAIGDPAWSCRSRDELLLDRAIRLLKGVEARIVCIDNVQDIPEHRGSRGLLMVGNWIRDLWDKSNCLIVLLGTPPAKEVIWANEQLRRRNPARVEIPYFGFSTEPDIARFKRYLQRIDEALPLAERSGLEQYAAPMFWATYGIQDYIYGILKGAVCEAVRAGREKIESSDLEAAWNEYMLDSAISGNPFCAEGPKRPLDRVGEPFFNWHRSAESEARRAAAASRNSPRSDGSLQ